MQLTLSQEGGPTTTIVLSQEEGEELKELLLHNIDCRLTTYCHRVGLQYTNVANMLGGRKKMSFRSLQRLLSASTLSVECRVEFIVRKEEGMKIADDVDFQSLDDVLFFDDLEDAPMEPLNETENSSTTEERSNEETNHQS